MTNKTLSDKRIKEKPCPLWWYEEKDVKEFIQTIKNKTSKMWWRRILHPLLDELAGDALVHSPNPSQEKDTPDETSRRGKETSGTHSQQEPFPFHGNHIPSNHEAGNDDKKCAKCGHDINEHWGTENHCGEYGGDEKFTTEMTNSK